jgi:trehalose utilization protein
MSTHRRDFIKTTALAVVGASVVPDKIFADTGNLTKIRVLVWDERAESEKEAYEDFIGNYIADHLKQQPNLSVISAALDDPDQGISEERLDQTDILIWWGHVRQAEVLPEKGKSIVNRIKSGKLGFIALHSAHWSTPFVESMNEVARKNLFADKTINSRDVKFIAPPTQFTVPKYDTRVTPYTAQKKFPDGRRELDLHLPYCCFPEFRNDGKPSTVTVLQKTHPVMQGIPATFQISKTEMYNEPFHVPAPDQVLFEECWENGEWFRSGMIWEIGKGKVFYFRPGHEAYPVYKEKWPMQIVLNAILWMHSFSLAVSR